MAVWNVAASQMGAENLPVSGGGELELMPDTYFREGYADVADVL